MEQITITLPDPAVKAFVDELIAQGTFASPGDYVLTLIREDRKRRARAQVEELLLDGLEGEPEALTDQTWEEMRRQYDERNPARTAP